ncbi:nuclear transport factor 2 family protein [Humibacillus xanthopallidus]|uniref:SnoaL-like protein n=1 Tax=Humibacillus xanthopallidus TaxID=412689 RepID=A0A543HI14_9MICO|nr:nuclear transport factor 2 family protein [Humibacillus xanthopallidus]TQM57927.1 SnoaL-like protein [Humibacillus xanthopallidus]
MSDDVALVLAWIEASQRARNSRQDFEALRPFLADDVQVKLASPWTDSPWRIAYTSADQMVERLTAPINQGSTLTTENTNVVQVGKDVLVEQLSTITLADDDHVSMVCHIFTVEDGRITQLRTYRNDHGPRPAEKVGDRRRCGRAYEG